MITEKPVSGYMGRILSAIAEKPCTAEELVDLCYSRHHGTVPSGPDNSVRTLIYHLKNRLLPGWRIEHTPGTYRLVKATQADLGPWTRRCACGAVFVTNHLAETLCGACR